MPEPAAPDSSRPPADSPPVRYSTACSTAADRPQNTHPLPSRASWGRRTPCGRYHGLGNARLAPGSGFIRGWGASRASSVPRIRSQSAAKTACMGRYSTWSPAVVVRTAAAKASTKWPWAASRKPSTAPITVTSGRATFRAPSTANAERISATACPA